ncbi:MAG: MarR family transcriptional regulator [Parvularculales bacterium]
MNKEIATFSLMLFRLRYEWRALLKDAIKDCDISPEEWLILICLKSNKSLDMTTLSNLQGINMPNVSKNVDRLSKKALVYRINDPNNKRRVLVHLSEFGDELLSNVANNVKQYRNQFKNKMTDDRWIEISNKLNKN